MSWKDASTREKMRTLHILETELCSYSHSLDSCRQLALHGGEQINLLRYLDSIVNCNKETCSQKVYAKFFLVPGFHIPQILT